MENGSGNVNGSDNGSDKSNGNGNVNEWQVPTLYKQHEMKTTTVLYFFLLEIIYSPYLSDLYPWNLDLLNGVEPLLECDNIFL